VRLSPQSSGQRCNDAAWSGSRPDPRQLAERLRACLRKGGVVILFEQIDRRTVRTFRWVRREVEGIRLAGRPLPSLWRNLRAWLLRVREVLAGRRLVDPE
jgi:hypothetical protein